MKQKTHIFLSVFLNLCGYYFFAPFLPAFAASISFFAAKRFFVLCGLAAVFRFGLSAIILVIFRNYIVNSVCGKAFLSIVIKY